MPTYSQLQAEPYWGREVVTEEMDWLGDELCRRTGRPRTAFGTKGDNHHLRGAHRSQEWIRRSAYCTNRTYTVQSGLTAEQERHVAGADFTPGSAAQMVAQCKRILAAMKRGDLDEVREFYGNVDGDRVVDGWDNVRDRAASSDSSHLWHWHLTIDRRHCRNRKLMERILAIALGEPVEDDDMTPEEHNWLQTVHRNLTVLDGRNPVGQIYTRMALGEDHTLDAEYKPEHPNLRSLSAQLTALTAAVTGIAGKDFTDEPAIIAGVLAGLTPEAIAAAIPTDMARQVADELAARLAG